MLKHIRHRIGEQEANHTLQILHEHSECRLKTEQKNDLMNRFLNESDKNAWQNSVRKAIQFTWLMSGNVRDVYWPNRRYQ